MRTLTLRNIDDEVSRRLEVRARERRRSVEQEALDIIEAVLSERIVPSDRLARAKEIAALSPGHQQTDSLTSLREDRAL